MNTLTKDDFTSEMAYVLYYNRHRLPMAIGVDPDDEWKFDNQEWEEMVPKYIRELVERDFYSGEKKFAADVMSHYNWTMFCLWEDLYEAGLETVDDHRPDH